MKPFFSIVLAVYNREKLIMRAIKSVLNQTFKNWELIIINDGSTDNSYESIKPFMQDKRISYCELLDNCGVSKARNKGINKAIGNYITFIDSDDEYAANHLQSRYEIVIRDQIDLLHGGVEIIGNKYVPDKNNIKKMIAIKDCIVGGTFFLNNNLEDELKFFDESVKYSEDSVLYEKILNKNKKIYKTDISTYIYYRETEDSICNRINE